MAKLGWEKTAIIIGMVSAVITIIIFITGKTHLFGHNEPPSGIPISIINSNNNSTTIIRSSTPPVVTPPDKTTRSSPHHRDSANAPFHAVKKAFLCIQTMRTGQQWDNNLSKKLALLFADKGYEAKETGLGSKEYSFDNLVSYNLTLSAPEEKKGPFNTVTIDYTVELTLEFYNGLETIPCTHRIYHETVSVNKGVGKDAILIQGVTGLVSQLKNETSFPFCIQK